MRSLVRRALEALGIRRLLLGVHDAALPGNPADDAGRGAPLSLGGLEFLRFAHDLGFDGIQLGPQGRTAEIDPSPYDGTLFSRNPLSLALGPLRAAGILPEEAFEEALLERPPGSDARVAQGVVFRNIHRALQKASDLEEKRLAFVAANADWLERDALYQALCAEHRDGDWLRWPASDRRLFHPAPGEEPAARARRADLLQRYAALVQRYQLYQFLADEQHQAFRAEARSLGLRLYGDLQIGISHQDIWSYAAVFLPSLRMGAPPSRTNPAGQPWNYALLDPAQYRDAALRFFRRRIDKTLREFDGLRIDHPHGLIDPWVYPTGEPDPFHAVQNGARLFSSPDVAHLAAHAIARDDQLDRTLPRHADGWVRDLSDEQVSRYAILFDALVEAARTHGLETDDLVAEVLSTLPYPVGRVIARHGLGRFRVLQKMRLDDPGDVYRSENARPEDWIMVGNHDTEPIWRVAERWQESGVAKAHAAHLAERFGAPDRARFVEAVASEPTRLARARLAELFLGPARHVSIFFSDLLGMKEPYNRPGTISDENWSARIPADFKRRYAEDARRGKALDLPRALVMALRARGIEGRLASSLEERAGPDPAAPVLVSRP
ncbi:MAG: 4-alpha-glucanotransferase [Myxococcales bacterium]